MPVTKACVLYKSANIKCTYVSFATRECQKGMKNCCGNIVFSVNSVHILKCDIAEILLKVALNTINHMRYGD
jgi:hypothetical protein